LIIQRISTNHFPVLIELLDDVLSFIIIKSSLGFIECSIACDSFDVILQKYPDYYDVIQDPIDLRTIAQKIQGNEYKCLDEMIRDLNQMIHNAKSFNETGSQIYRVCDC